MSKARHFQIILFLLAILPGAISLTCQDLVDPANWRGFNLLECYNKRYSPGNYHETDFALLAKAGFTFVRLPIDYRFFADPAAPGDSGRFSVKGIAAIDKAVTWGKQYGIHVSLNLHRAPGYCVNPPAESVSLWSDPQAQKAFIAEWAFWAEYLQSFSPAELSFNLINEPPDSVPPLVYEKLMRQTAEAIWKISPSRPIMIDGLNYGRLPVKGWIDQRLIQSVHCYEPMSLTHYHASWIEGSSKWPVPVWPRPAPLLGIYLYGNSKPDLHRPVSIEGDFPAGTQLEIHVDTVSTRADLRLAADGQDFDNHDFRPHGGPGEWKRAIWKQQWGIWQNEYDRNYLFTVPVKSSHIELRVETGDWLAFSRISIRRPGQPTLDLIPDNIDWGWLQPNLRLQDDGMAVPATSGGPAKPSTILEDFFAPWVDYAAAGGLVFTGEWGAYEAVPAKPALAWSHDLLALLAKNHWGWALWNLRGSFGPFDSKRPDAVYQDGPDGKVDQVYWNMLQGK